MMAGNPPPINVTCVVNGTDDAPVRVQVSIRHCVKAPEKWWVIDDMSIGSGYHDDKPTTLKAVRANPFTKLADVYVLMVLMMTAFSK